MRTVLHSLAIGCIGMSLLAGSVLTDSALAAEAGGAVHHDAEDHANAMRRAARNVEIARLKLRHYIHTEYPLRLQQLNSEVKIGEAEVRLLRKRVDAYRYVSHRDRNDYSSPTTVNIKQAENALLAAELHLEQVKAERSALINNDRSRRRLFKLELEAALDELDSLRPKASEPKAIRNHRNAA